MKKAGIIGGLGPASTIDYYRDIVENFRKKHGEDCYPELIFYSVNMHEVIAAVERADYKAVADILRCDINSLAKAGAEFAAISANTPHIAWKYLEGTTEIPVISIIDVVCDEIAAHNYNKVLIFATSFTMKNGLFQRAFEKRGIDYIVPSAEDIEVLGNIIYPNLENGIVIKEDKAKMISIANRYIKEFACDALLLGCTEIPLMIQPGDVSVPLINSTQVHVQRIGEEIDS